MTKPIISVIIVTYNRLNVLKNCIDSILKQSLPREKYELIIVDDGSEDGTKEYMQSLEDKPFVKCFYNNHQGYMAERNFGAAEARGTYITYTDDDCVAEPKWLEKVVETFAMDDSIGVVGAVTKVAFNNKFFTPLNKHFRKKPDLGNRPQIEIIEGITGFVGLNPFSGCNLHIKKELFDEFGGFDESIGPGEDVDFLYKYLAKGGKAANRMDLWVDHYERDDLYSMFKRWFTFGKSDAEIVRRYLHSNLSIEVNLLQGIINYNFIKIPFPFGVYFQLNLLKVILAMILIAFFSPKVGLSLLVLLIGGFFIKQKNPKFTASFLFYLLYLEIGYTLGFVSGGLKKRLISV